MILKSAAVLAAATAALSGPATEQAPIQIDLPAAALGWQVLMLGRLGRVSVAVPDPALWAMKVPALEGRMPIRAALELLARRVGGRLMDLGPRAFEMSAGPRVKPHLRPPPAPTVPPKPVAAAAKASALQPVVVVASKRAVPERLYAGQVDRVSGEDLQFGGAGGVERLEERLSSLITTDLGPGRNKIFLRGVSDSSFTGPSEATVGEYFGDLRLTYNAPDPDLRLADLEAVEVLEGPQGTLYGAGSLGGLIRFVPNPVDLTRASGSLVVGGSATVHGAPGADGEAVLNMPVVDDRLGVRVVATAESDGGYIDDPALARRDVNRTAIEGGRATVHLRIGDGWSAEVVGLGQEISGDSQYADAGAPPLTRYAPVGEGYHADFGQGQVIVEGRIGDAEVRSSTGITGDDLLERYDATIPGGPPSLFVETNRTRMTANETRMFHSSPDGSGWVIGFSYFSNRSRLTELIEPTDPSLPGPSVTNSVRETTVYGEKSWRVLTRVLLTAGLRLSRTALDGTSENALTFSDPEVFEADTAARRSHVSELPSASALVEITPRSSVYLRYQEGLRPGGLGLEDGYVDRFHDDRVAAVELGYRYGGRPRDPISIDAAVAHTSWRDIQANFVGDDGLPSTGNFGDAELWTLETTGGLTLFNGLRLKATLTYNFSNITTPDYDLPGSDSGVADNATPTLSRIPNIPAVASTLYATYEGHLLDRASVKIDGWARYVGPSYAGVGSAFGAQQQSYVNTGVTARVGLGHLGLTGSIVNLADQRRNRFALANPYTGDTQVTPLRPLTFRLGLDAVF